MSEAVDPEAGRVVRIATGAMNNTSNLTPSVFFKYKEFCDAVGVTRASLAEKPFVVLKVKAENLNLPIASLLGATRTTDTETLRKELFARIPDGSGWQYICFDFSSVSNSDTLTMFRLITEQLAAQKDETLYLSELCFCTAAEAAEYITPDVYPAGERSADDYRLSVLQFNIQTENGNHSPFRIRAAMYRKLVDELMPDVVGMEEVTVNWLKWLDALVFNDSYAGVGEARTPGGEANSIYYRKDKFELVDSGTFWLSDTPDVPGSYLENCNYPRICTWVILRDKVTGTEFAHMNTHLDHNGKNDSTTGNNIRKDQMRVIIKFAQRFGDLPLFLTGDLNNRRTTSGGNLYALYKLITGESSFKDENGVRYRMTLADSRLNAASTVPEDRIATMTANYDESSTSYNPAKEPIDYVFYNPANTAPLTYNTFLIKDRGHEISDHLPVYTTFRID